MRVLLLAIALLPIFGNAANATKLIVGKDSSASSNSGTPSKSLASIGSGPNAADSSSGDSSSGSFNQGSWAGDSSGSQDSSGSTASGSWGSQMPIWLWIVILAFLCLKCGIIAACCGGKKKPKKKKTSKAKPAAPVPVAEPLTAEPLLPEVPPLMPLATTSQLIPSYSMVQQAPQYNYGQMPATTSYMQPQYAAQAPQYAQYAAPATAPMQMQSYQMAPGGAVV